MGTKKGLNWGHFMSKSRSSSTSLYALVSVERLGLPRVGVEEPLGDAHHRLHLLQERGQVEPSLGPEKRKRNESRPRTSVSGGGPGADSIENIFHREMDEPSRSISHYSAHKGRDSQKCLWQ